MEDAQIIGKANDQEAGQAKSFLSQEKEIGGQRLVGELEKTDEEQRFIDTTKRYLKKEFESLGIAEFPPLEPGQLHIFDTRGFVQNFGPDAPDAITDTMSSAVYIDKERYESRFAFYIALFHEEVHLVSHQKFQHYRGSLPVATYRAGYTNTDFRKRPNTEHFRGFDEAVVDMTMNEIVEENWGELSTDFQFTDEDKKYFESLKSSSEVGYGDYTEVVKFILGKVAEDKGESYEDVWKRVKKGMFTGDMMHLRDIEKTFGNGSLRILAHLGVWGDEGPQKDDPQEVLKWFQSSDSSERDQIAQRMLPPREYEKYKK